MSASMFAARLERLVSNGCYRESFKEQGSCTQAPSFPLAQEDCWHARASTFGRDALQPPHVRAGCRRPVGHTLASASTLEADLRGTDGTKVEKARKVGEKIAERAKDAGIEAVVFDRGGNKYHGRVAAVAEGAREAGLTL